MSVIGVDVGGTKIAAGLLGPDLRVLRSVVVPSPGEGRTIIDLIVGLVADLATDAPDEVRGVGVGLPATIDGVTGRVAHSVHTDMSDFDATGPLERRIGLPVSLDNDANLAALAEHRLGAARGMDTAVVLTVGTGVGGGIILGGQVFRGGRGHGAELGHIAVNADGPPCQGGCPGHGCLEAMCSGTAITRDVRAFADANPGSAMGRRHAEGDLDSHSAGEMARKGDADAIACFATAGRWLGIGIASLTNVFDPDVVVVGGGVSCAGDLLLEPARHEYVRRALPPTTRAQVVGAALGPDAGFVGAAIMAHEAAGGRVP